MKSLSQMIRQYRQGQTQLQRYNTRIEKLQQKINEIRNHQNELQKEVQNTRTVIDFCIETGQSPVEAKLRNTLAQMENETYKSRDSYDASGYTTLTSVGLGAYTINGTIGSTLSQTGSYIHGASGIIGTNHNNGILNPGNISVAGAAGSTYTPLATHVKGGLI